MTTMVTTCNYIKWHSFGVLQFRACGRPNKLEDPSGLTFGGPTSRELQQGQCRGLVNLLTPGSFRGHIPLDRYLQGIFSMYMELSPI